MLAQQQQQQQQEEYMRQQMLMQQQQQQQEEYMRQQQLMQQQQQQQLFAQPTGYGSNNPFAPPQPQGSLLDQQSTATQSSFSPMPTFNQQQQPSPAPATLSPSPPAAAKPTWQNQPKKDDGDHAGLANLLARGREDGLDTFGNQGNLRKYRPAQYAQASIGAVTVRSFEISLHVVDMLRIAVHPTDTCRNPDRRSIPRQQPAGNAADGLWRQQSVWPDGRRPAAAEAERPALLLHLDRVRV